MPPTAVVMNMFYTGLGIARSLGEHGIPVVGLTADRGIYGNFTRYARIAACPNSRTEPEALRDFLMALGPTLGAPAVIFPTRDDDLVFLDRFRDELGRFFRLAVPERPVLEACLDKWQTWLWARQAGVPAPASWMIEDREDLSRVIGQVTYPCVLKPALAHQWRQGDNWRLVGARKAIGISSREELEAEYEAVAKAGPRALIQEMIPGGDQSLAIVACFLDRSSRWVDGFNTQKLVQVPEIFGTGCIVRAARYPELTASTARMLEAMRFTGIAEVEYKWDQATGNYKLIEINPRPWDQHRLGKTCGVDLVWLSYCEHAGLPVPVTTARTPKYKWIAEDTFITAALSFLWKRNGRFADLLRQARGKRIYAIWSARDPLPFLAYFATRFIPAMIGAAWQVVWRSFAKRGSGDKSSQQKKEVVYASHMEKGKSHS